MKFTRVMSGEYCCYLSNVTYFIWKTESTCPDCNHGHTYWKCVASVGGNVGKYPTLKLAKTGAQEHYDKSTANGI